MDSLPGALLFPESSAYWVQFLLDLGLKSTITLLGALALAAVCRRAGAAARHRIWSAAVCGLLALPLLAPVLPEWRAPLLPSWRSEARPAQPGIEGEVLAAVGWVKNVGASASPVIESPIAASFAPAVAPPRATGPISAEGGRRAFNWPLAALIIWLIGSLAVIVRLLLGTFRVRRLARQASSMSGSSWEALVGNVAASLDLRRRVMLLRSAQVTLPMTWGALRSVVMLPEDADSWSPNCRRVVLLHELAHVERRDCLTQMLAQLACALYWFNPLIWVAARRLRVERELACDDRVLEAGTKASDYAAHLVEIASSFGGAGLISPVVAGMGGTQLERRVQAILDPRVRRRMLPRLGAWRLDLGAACLIVPLAMVQPWADTAAVPPPPESVGPAIPSVGGFAVYDPSDSPAGERSASASAPEADRTPENEKIDRSAAQTGTEDARPSEDQSSGQTTAQGAGQAAGQGGSAEPTVEQIIQMKIHGVTSEYIESLRRLGYDNLTVDQATNLKIHGITEDYVNQVRQWAGSDLSLDKLVQLRIHGVTSEYARRMKDLGFADLLIDKLVAMRIHGVDEQFVREVEAMGFAKQSVDKLIAMRIHGVNEGFIKEMRGLGFDNLTLDELLQMRIHGVTREYVEKMRAAGFRNASVNQLIEMRIHGIDRILLKGNR